MADSQNTILQEIWKEIPGFPGYEVSNHGHVRSYWRKVGLGDGGGSKSVIESYPQKILKPLMDYGGYPYVRLRKNNKHHHRTVHRLVLEVFVGSCPPGMEACHNNGSPGDGYFSNLRWDTHKNNTLDRRQHGTIPDRKGGKHPLAKLTEDQVVEIRKLASQNIYSQRTISKMFGVSRPTISFIVARKRWTHI